MKKDIIIISLLTIVLIAIIHFRLREKSEQDNLPQAEPEEVIIRKEYGIAIDSFMVFRDKIRYNQNLAVILRDLKVPGNLINLLGKIAPDTFDIRKIRAGNNYTAFCTRDTAERLCFFVYEHTPVDFFVLEFSDTLHVFKSKKEIRIEKKVFSDTISNSLWMTMKDNNTNPLLAIDLSEIYAWVIDFFMLDKNDKITVIYDEEFVDSASIGIGKIYAAKFTHLGKDFYAIPFKQDDAESYFDEEGRSLRRQFLKAPLRYSRISSRFSYSRMHPVLRIRRPHLGVDYAAAIGTPVQAVGDGVVIKAGWDNGAGWYLKIRHNSVYTTGYLHLRAFGKGVKQGAHVRQGQVIGYVGSTGLSTGPHLDFRFWRNGHAIDPLQVKAPPVDPIKEENETAYDSVKVHWLTKLSEHVFIPDSLLNQ